MSLKTTKANRPTFTHGDYVRWHTGGTAQKVLGCENNRYGEGQLIVWDEETFSVWSASADRFVLAAAPVQMAEAA